MEQALRRNAAISGRDYPLATPAQQRKPETATTPAVWAQRPFRTASGRQLLAFRIVDGVVFALQAGAVPRWVLAETLMSERTARRWLAAAFGKAEVVLKDSL